MQNRAAWQQKPIWYAILMKEIILIKNGELALKGLNRRTFEDMLVKNMRRRLESAGKFNFTRPNSLSSVTINLTDGKEFQYGECNISFEIINRTDVRVVISNQDGSEIYFDQNTDLNYVMPRLNAKEEYYNITVYNLGDKDQRIQKGAKISQLLILPVMTMNPVLVEEVAGGDRGSDGFGSTGD